MKVNYYTKGGLNKLRLELNQLKDVERPKASKAIAEARDKGDLSENAEYDAAKEAQGLLNLKFQNWKKRSLMLDSLMNLNLIPQKFLFCLR